VSALSATQVDRRKYAAIAAEKRPEPDLRLGHPNNEGQYDHATLRVKPINLRFDHIASFQREVKSKSEDRLLRN
jgi:hypothetical protein